jgi:hypothetical protein
LQLASLSSHFAYEICKFSDVGNTQRSALADNQAKQVQPTQLARHSLAMRADTIGNLRQSGRGGAPTVIYVSCGPESLGRDLAALGAAGWAPDAIEPFDLMPGTAQVETVVRLRRRGAAPP